MGLGTGLLSCAQNPTVDAFAPRLARPQTGDVVVAQPVAGDYQAFSAVCTHSGCLINQVADGTIGPEEGVKMYRSMLDAKGISAHRSLDDDMILHSPGLIE
mgnify:CR=1 FL=1